MKDESDLIERLRALFFRTHEFYTLADECGQLAYEIVRDYDFITDAVPGLPYFIEECEDVTGIAGNILADIERQRI